MSEASLGQTLKRSYRSSQSRNAILALALLCALPKFYLADLRQYPTYDGAMYMHQAQVLLRDHDFRFGPFPPGWPTALAGTCYLLGKNLPREILGVATLLNALLGTLCAFLVYATLRTRGRDVTLVLIVLISASPTLLTASTCDLSDLLALVLEVAAVLALARAPVVAGLALGLAYAVRPEAAVIALAILTSEALRKRMSRVAWLSAGFLVAALPHQVLGYAATGRILSNAKAGWLVSAFSQSDAIAFARNYLSNALELLRLTYVEFGPVWLLLALIGLRGRRPVTWSLVVPLLVLPAFEFRMDPRYLLCAIFPLAELGARGLVQLRSASPRRWRGLRPRRALPYVLLGIQLLIWVGPLRRINVNAEAFPTYREAGEWLAGHASPEAVVGDRKPYAAFWAGMEYRRVPLAGDLETLLSWIADEHLDYVVVHQGVAGGMAPVLVPLLGDLPPILDSLVDLQAVFTIENRPLESVLVYSVRSEPRNR